MTSKIVTLSSILVSRKRELLSSSAVSKKHGPNGSTPSTTISALPWSAFLRLAIRNARFASSPPCGSSGSTKGGGKSSSRAIERVLESSAGTTATRVRVLQGAAWTAWRRGDVPGGSAVAEESLRLSRELDDPWLIARSLHILAACVSADDPARATNLDEESARYSESAGDWARLAATLQNLAVIAWEAGDHQRASDGFARALEVARQSGNKFSISVSVMSLAHAERALGEYQRAKVHFGESLQTAGTLGIKEVVVETLYGVAALAADAGDHEWAGALVGAAQRENDFGHDFDLESMRQLHDHTLSSISENLGADGMERAIAAGRALTLDSVLEYLRGGPDVQFLSPPATPSQSSG